MKNAADPAQQLTELTSAAVQNAEMLRGLTGSLEQFMQRQEKENGLLHERITATQDQFSKGMQDVQAALSRSGRVNWGVVVALIAVVLSLTAITGGAVTTFVRSALEPIASIAIKGEQRIDRIALEFAAHRDAQATRDAAQAEMNGVLQERSRWLMRTIQ